MNEFEELLLTKMYGFSRCYWDGKVVPNKFVKYIVYNEYILAIFLTYSDKYILRGEILPSIINSNSLDTVETISFDDLVLHMTDYLRRFANFV